MEYQVVEKTQSIETFAPQTMHSQAHIEDKAKDISSAMPSGPTPEWRSMLKQTKNVVIGVQNVFNFPITRFSNASIFNFSTITYEQSSHIQ
jgi:hypothetical protein